MAVGYSYSVPAPVVIQKSAARKSVSIVVRSADNKISVSSGSSRTPFQIRLPSRSKVFEDRSKGIVCYREENGEITCEGIDEGPRFYCRSSRFSSNQREAEIIDLLERSLLQMVQGDKFN